MFFKVNCKTTEEEQTESGPSQSKLAIKPVKKLESMAILKRRCMGLMSDLSLKSPQNYFSDNHSNHSRRKVPPIHARSNRKLQQR
jgi:hypothetical protein